MLSFPINDLLAQMGQKTARVLAASVLAGFAMASPLMSPATAQGVGQVETSSLGDVDPLLIGTLTPQEGGLSRDLWTGADARGVAEAAARLPGETSSRAAARLATRVLSSPGFSPGGAGDPRTAAAARARALLALGNVDVVDTLITQTPRGFDEPELAALAVRARLAKNEITPACRIGDTLTNGRDGGFWLRLRAACYAWAGESSAAQLTLDLAREADAEVADEDFATWVFAAGQGAMPSNTSPPRDALEASLARSAGALIQGEVLDGLPLLVAVGVARDTDAPPLARAEAALRAARAGALTTAELSEALDALAPADGTSMSELLEQGRGDPSLRGFALLRQAALSNDGGPFIAAEALDAALARASSPAEFVVLSLALRDALAAVPASPELVRNAAMFARAAAAINDVELAHAWLNPTSQDIVPPSSFASGPQFDGFTPTAIAAPDFSGSPVEAVSRLDAEVLAAAINPHATPSYLASVALARIASTLSEDDTVRAAARRDALILLALGAETSPSLRRAAVAAVSEVEPVSGSAAQALTAARLAAQAGSLGEAALYVAQAAGEAGPRHGPTAAFAVEIAMALGLEEDARAIAVEALLATRVAVADDDEG